MHCGVHLIYGVKIVLLELMQIRLYYIIIYYYNVPINIKMQDK